MIYLRLCIEPAFHAPGQPHRAYRADVMVSSGEIEKAMTELSGLLAEQGWQVLALREAELGLPIPSIEDQPELHHLHRQAAVRGLAYRIERSEDQTDDTLRVRVRHEEPEPAHSGTALEFNPERAAFA